MRTNPELIWILQDLSSFQEIMETNNQKKPEILSNQILNLEDLTFSQGNHFMSNKTCQLPNKSFRLQKKGYEEIHIPSPTPPKFNTGEVNYEIQKKPKKTFSIILDSISNIKFTKICSTSI